MPKKYKPAPKDYYDMKGSVERNKKVKHSEVFGKVSNSKESTPNKNTKKKIPKKKSNY
jgi:hypothetical protein